MFYGLTGLFSLPFYSFCSEVAHVFVLQIAMESYRGVDDIFNGAMGGSMAFGLMMIPFGIRSSLLGFVVGFPFGAGLSLFMYGGEAWRQKMSSFTTASSVAHEDG
jgi:hypothetical protein